MILLRRGANRRPDAGPHAMQAGAGTRQGWLHWASSQEGGGSGTTECEWGWVGVGVDARDGATAHTPWHVDRRCEHTFTHTRACTSTNPELELMLAPESNEVGALFGINFNCKRPSIPQQSHRRPARRRPPRYYGRRGATAAVRQSVAAARAKREVIQPKEMSFRRGRCHSERIRRHAPPPAGKSSASVPNKTVEH